MIFSSMLVDMTELRKQALQKEAMFTKQPSHQTMMVFCQLLLKLQIEIHTWVLIHPVMNSITLTPINLIHLCLLDITSTQITQIKFKY